jgi:lysophospholipase L1-like esterase
MKASIKFLLLFVTLGFSLARANAESLQPAGSPATVRVACVGDSITQGVGAEPGKSYPSQLQALLGDGWTVKNFGVGGRTLLRKGDFPYWEEKAFRDAQEFQPNVVVLMLGTNDTKPQNWQFHDQFHDDYRDLVKTFRALPSKPRIYVCRPCPVPEPGNYGINEANVQREIPIIDQVAREGGATIIDIHAALEPHPELMPDRVHPNTAGAAILAATVAKVIAGK